jgi:hypothetical protein
LADYLAARAGLGIGDHIAVTQSGLADDEDTVPSELSDEAKDEMVTGAEKA